MNSLTQLQQAWGSEGYPPTSVKESDIASLEAELGLRFPNDYRTSILEAGLPRITTDLWEWIDDTEEEIDNPLEPYRAHLSEFYTPDGIRSALEWVKAGMPVYLVPFASDSGGNQFCFSKNDMTGSANQASVVFYWDHDFGDTEIVGESFDDWLRLYIPE